MHAQTLAESISIKVATFAINRFALILSVSITSLVPTLCLAQGFDQNLISYLSPQATSNGVSNSGYYLAPNSLEYDQDNAYVSFSGGYNGTLQSTMVWTLSSGDLLSWSFDLGNNNVITYVDGTSQGYPGSLIRTGGNGIVTVDVMGSTFGHLEYDQTGAMLSPFDSYFGYGGSDIISLKYGDLVYQLNSGGPDFNGNKVARYTVGSNICQIKTTPQGRLQIGQPTSGIATYQLNSKHTKYVLQDSPPPTNRLNQINGYPLTVTPSYSALPTPSIKKFVWKGFTRNANDVFWTSGVLGWNFVSDDGGAAQASYQTNGALISLQVSDTNGNSATLTPGSGPGKYHIQSATGSAIFASFNDIPYVIYGGELVPQGMINTFNYDSTSYQFSGSTTVNGNWISSYHASNGNTATLEYSPITGEMIKFIVNTAGGKAAIYVNGATVGRPGAYVLSSSSTDTNQLTGINGQTYTVSGDMSMPTSTLVNNNGVFDINGNFMTLGIWSNDPRRVGMSLSYNDGVPVTIPARIEFTASRPVSSWAWNAATEDNSGVTPMMELDESSRLLLYPAGEPSTGDAAVPEPAVVLDPSVNGISRFGGAVRFDQAVRISPQGDLSMGEFTHDAFAPQ